MNLLGAPLGTFSAIRYILSTQSAAADGDDLRIADVQDLEYLKPLLAAGRHAQRIRAGDVCLWIEGGGTPAGVVWLNLSTHSDKHYGAWSAPTARRGYVNQLVVSENARGKGIATRLVRATQRAALEAGRDAVFTIVLQDNYASRRVFEKCGSRAYGWLYGARFGGIGTLRVPLPPLGLDASRSRG